MSSGPVAAGWDPAERRRELIAGCQARLEGPGVRVEELLEIARVHEAFGSGVVHPHRLRGTPLARAARVLG
jgi:hypothetical protein